MKYPLILFACVGVLSACDAAPSAPEATAADASLARTRLNERVPFTFQLANPCPPPENVLVDGTLHVVQHGETDENGATFRTHLNLHGSGIGGVTGAIYQLVQTGRQEATVTTTPVSVITESTTNFALIRQGSLDNVFVHARLRVVCDEDGCRPEINVIETECRG